MLAQSLIEYSAQAGQSLIEYSAQAGKGGGSVATIAFACLRVAQNK